MSHESPWFQLFFGNRKHPGSCFSVSCTLTGYFFYLVYIFSWPMKTCCGILRRKKKFILNLSHLPFQLFRSSFILLKTENKIDLTMFLRVHVGAFYVTLQFLINVLHFLCLGAWFLFSLLLFFFFFSSPPLPPCKRKRYVCLFWPFGTTSLLVGATDSDLCIASVRSSMTQWYMGCIMSV